MSGLIPIATCIQDTWEIIKPIGKGNFLFYLESILWLFLIPHNNIV